MASTPALQDDLSSLMMSPPTCQKVISFAKTSPPNCSDAFHTSMTPSPDCFEVIFTPFRSPLDQSEVIFSSLSSPPACEKVLSTSMTSASDCLEVICTSMSSPPACQQILSSVTSPPACQQILSSMTSPPACQQILSSSVTSPPACQQILSSSMTSPPACQQILSSSVTSPPACQQILSSSMTSPPACQQILSSSVTSPPACQQVFSSSVTSLPACRQILSSSVTSPPACQQVPFPSMTSPPACQQLLSSSVTLSFAVQPAPYSFRTSPKVCEQVLSSLTTPPPACEQALSSSVMSPPARSTIMSSSMKASPTWPLVLRESFPTWPDCLPPSAAPPAAAPLSSCNDRYDNLQDNQTFKNQPSNYYSGFLAGDGRQDLVPGYSDSARPVEALTDSGPAMENDQLPALTSITIPASDHNKPLTTLVPFNTQAVASSKKGLPRSEGGSSTKPRRVSSTSAMTEACAVCEDTADGYFFGALVCLPCKNFFLRYTTSKQLQANCAGTCNMVGSGRARCRHCRFQKCLAAGMVRKERPEAVAPEDGQVLCKVCMDIANGIHFGVVTCEGCKKFFHRGLQESHRYRCTGLATVICPISPRRRNKCRYCRFQRCLQAGMSRQAIKLGRRKTEQTRGCPSRVHSDQTRGCPSHVHNDQTRGCPSRVYSDQTRGCPSHVYSAQTRGFPSRAHNDQTRGCPSRAHNDQTRGCPSRAHNDQTRGCPSRAHNDQTRGCPSRAHNDQTRGCPSHVLTDHQRSLMAMSTCREAVLLDDLALNRTAGPGEDARSSSAFTSTGFSQDSAFSSRAAFDISLRSPTELSPVAGDPCCVSFATTSGVRQPRSVAQAGLGSALLAAQTDGDSMLPWAISPCMQTHFSGSGDGTAPPCGPGSYS